MNETRAASPPVPRSLLEYARSFGPGIVIMFTWLGAGDVVDMGVAGSNYSAQVVLLPLLAGGLWWITASPRHIGAARCTRWWENVLMDVLFALAPSRAVTSVRSIVQFVSGR